MKFVRFLEGRVERWGVLEERVVREISLDEGNPLNYRAAGEEYPLESIRLLAPCRPSKIICLGLNYRSHAEEVKR